MPAKFLPNDRVRLNVAPIEGTVVSAVLDDAYNVQVLVEYTDAEGVVHQISMQSEDPRLEKLPPLPEGDANPAA